VPAQPLDRSAGAALYLQIAADLRRRIEAGEWPEGASLPPQRVLITEYGGVDKNTLTSAYKELERLGVLSRDTTFSPVVRPRSEWGKTDHQRIEDLEARVREIEARELAHLRQAVDELQAQLADLYHARGEEAPPGLRGRGAARGSRPG
jgi:DNA-binding FadR family transcriptional regulator